MGTVNKMIQTTGPTIVIVELSIFRLSLIMVELKFSYVLKRGYIKNKWDERKHGNNRYL